MIPPLVDLEKYAGLKFDIRYARADNFIGEAVYSMPKAYLLRHVALDLMAVHQQLAEHGFGLLIFDGYRPWSVTKLFWDRSTEEVRQFLANPETGSSHNRGCAVDLSMYHLDTGEPVMMPSDFDEMNEKAFTEYPGGSDESRCCRDLLQATMKANHFLGIKNEWWHFNHRTHQGWPVMYLTFEEIELILRNPHPSPEK